MLDVMSRRREGSGKAVPESKPLLTKSIAREASSTSVPSPTNAGLRWADLGEFCIKCSTESSRNSYSSHRTPLESGEKRELLGKLGSYQQITTEL